MIRIISLIFLVGCVAGGYVYKDTSGPCASGMGLTSESECQAAATANGVNFASESTGALSYAPTNCYKMGATIKWDADGNNFGDCGYMMGMVKCVCSDGNANTPPPTPMHLTPPPTVNIAPSPTVHIISTPPPTPQQIIVVTTGHHQTYKAISSDEECEPVTSMQECKNAAIALGLGNGGVIDDGQNAASWDPPNCYVEWDQVKYNSAGNNTGSCHNLDVCICRADIIYAQIDHGNNCGPYNTIETVGECFTAAKQVLDSNIQQMPISSSESTSSDPPYCYFESGQLKFNEFGGNTGDCSGNDVCLCKYEESNVVATVVDELVKLPGVQEVIVTNVAEESAPNLNVVDVNINMKIHANCPNDQACTQTNTRRRLLGE